MNFTEHWLPTVPKKWSVKPLRAIASLNISSVDKIPADDEFPVRLANYTDVYKHEFISSDMELMQATATANEIERFRLHRDDVIITKDSETWDDIGIPALVVDSADDLVCGYHLAILRSDKTKLDGRFLLRCLQSKDIRIQLELAADGVTRFGIPKDAIGKLQLPVPPLAEQRAITKYLDKETGRMDALVAAKERWLELLAEKRRALITRAVTRGLNPAAPLSDSGFPWLGQVPKHWRVERSKWLFKERDERSTTGEEVLLSLRMEVGLVRHNDVSEKLTRSEELIGYKKTSPGEIVVNRMRASSGLVSITPEEGLVSPDYAVFQASPEADQKYFVHLFKTELLQALFRSESTGLGTGESGFLRLYSESFLAFWFPLPPLAEQRAIVAHIASATAKLDGLRAAAERTIALLKERRAALIAAAVTGKIQIPIKK